ncbi:MAG TPA: beta-N-acetylhexosaminidase [Terriglobales bacterium]|nr:beta-N-acetylhexosaminidase [Terriglobales bacterium]
MPRRIAFRPGVARLSPEWRIVAADSLADRQSIALLAGDARRLQGCAWSASSRSVRQPRQAIALRPSRRSWGAPASVRDQSYRLTIATDRVVIEARTSQGRFYGVQTFRQLLRAHRTGRLPCMEITDWPSLAWRGVSDDISRGQAPTSSSFSQIIQTLAYYKINLYQLYIEDAYAFAATPQRARSGRLTRDELAAVAREARRNHIVLCPILETVSHQSALLTVPAHRRYAATSQEAVDLPSTRTARPGVLGALRRVAAHLVIPSSSDVETPDGFSITDPRALRFVEGLVGELAAVTRGPYFHVGGDEWEAPGVSTGSGAPSADSAARQYGRYVGELSRFLKQRHGCTTMVYSDVLLRYPPAAATLPRDLVVVDWHYDPSDSFLTLGRLRGWGFHDLMVSPALWNWRSIYPDYAWAFRNIAASVASAVRFHALGCIVASWGDAGAESLRENNWPGYAFSAAAAWEGRAPETGLFLDRFATAHFGVTSPRLARALRILGWQDLQAMRPTERLYYRPPLVRPRSRAWVRRMEALAADMRTADRDLGAMLGEARTHRQQILTTQLSARRYAFAAERELFLDSAGVCLGNRTSADLAPRDREWLAVRLRHLRTTADALRLQYGHLWLESNRRGGLPGLDQRMARQAGQLGRLETLARAGRLKVDASFSRMQAIAARF